MFGTFRFEHFVERFLSMSPVCDFAGDTRASARWAAPLIVSLKEAP
jgi:hypothetical protein